MLYVYPSTLLFFITKMKSVSTFVIGYFCIVCCVSSGGMRTEVNEKIGTLSGEVRRLTEVNEKIRKLSGGVRRLTEDNEKIRTLTSVLQTDLKNEMNLQNDGEDWKARSKESDEKMILKELERQRDAVPNKTENKSSRNRQKRSTAEFNITDPCWPMQWYLQPDQKPSMGIYEAWLKGYTGKGIVVGLLGKGMDIAHPDLIENYNASLSYDFVDNTVGGSFFNGGHGTLAAGVIAASKNDQCIIGIAYEATIASFRAATLEDGMSYAAFAKSYMYNYDEIDIYTYIFGPGSGHGRDFHGMNELLTLVILKGITEGRNGKGSIYVQSAGSDGRWFDDCNTVALYNSMYTIAINAMAPDGRPASYAEQCTSVMAATYGGQDYRNGTEIYLPTTNDNNTCIANYYGTSAAASVASGILALTLQANPNLMWRDVQYLLVETSTFDDIPDAHFTVNGAGKNVSVSYGFGVMNADHLVETATSWRTVPKRLTCMSEASIVDKWSSRTIETSYVLEDCLIQYLEHVQVQIVFKSYYREHTEIHLVSPQGTDSRVLRQRKDDFEYSEVKWTFMSLHYWGENPSGNWSIRMDDFLNCDNIMYLHGWVLTVYGTITNPLEGIPNNGTQGGYCDNIILCTDGTDCLLDSNICVDCTIPGHRILDGFCVKDGYWYCDTTISCKEDHSWCNADNVCETCAKGYRLIDDTCIQDGKLGGYCDIFNLCEESDVACDSRRDQCMNCTDGYHIVDGFCKEDGISYCDTETPCIKKGVSCKIITRSCVACYLHANHRVVEGFCIEVGTLGGYCDSSTSCVVPGSGCNTETGLCIDCSMTGYHIVAGYCKQDGTVGGYCDRDVVCVNETGCVFESNLCVNCSSSGYRVLPDGSCREDGMVDGYCDSETPCVTFAAVCLPGYNICATCYAGNTIVDGHCIEDDAPETQVAEVKLNSYADTAIGVAIAGFATGVLINGVVFMIVLQKALLAKTG